MQPVVQSFRGENIGVRVQRRRQAGGEKKRGRTTEFSDPEKDVKMVDVTKGDKGTNNLLWLPLKGETEQHRRGSNFEIASKERRTEPGGLRRLELWLKPQDSLRLGRPCLVPALLLHQEEGHHLEEQAGDDLGENGGEQLAGDQAGRKAALHQLLPRRVQTHWRRENHWH